MIARLAPEHGGAVLSLRYGSANILRPASSIEAVARDPREAACYPCVPWFSRLPGGLDFQDRHYDLAPTLPACDPVHALHGHGWVSAWRVIEVTPQMARCQFEHKPAPGVFPFAFSAEQVFMVGVKDLSIELSITNTHSTDIPFGLGLHPFFPCDGETRLNVIERRAPTRLIGGLKAPEVINHSGPIPAEEVDYTLFGWDGTADIVHAGAVLKLSSSARFVHLYSPDSAEFYCVEPISHIPGKFGKDLLSPGECASINMKLSLA